MSNTPALFRQFPIGKQERKDMIAALKEDILSGKYDLLEMEIRLKSIEDIINSIRKDSDISGYVIEEAEKYQKGDVVHGASVTVMSRKTYDYTSCNDSVYNDLIAQQKQLSDVIKAREAVLRTGINPDTGEYINKPAEKETQYLKIEWK